MIEYFSIYTMIISNSILKWCLFFKLFNLSSFFIFNSYSTKVHIWLLILGSTISLPTVTKVFLIHKLIINLSVRHGIVTKLILSAVAIRSITTLIDFTRSRQHLMMFRCYKKIFGKITFLVKLAECLLLIQISLRQHVRFSLIIIFSHNTWTCRRWFVLLVKCD